MKPTKQNIIKYLLFTLTLILFTNGCFCPNPDYTTEIKEILDPVSQNLEDFYTKNKRFPNTKERNKILEDRGCLFGDKGDGYCKKYGVWFELISRVGGGIKPPNDYTLRVKYQDVSCWVGLYTNGKKAHNYADCGNHCSAWKQ